MADAEKQPLLQNDTATGYQGGQVDIVEGNNLNNSSDIFLCFSLSTTSTTRSLLIVSKCMHILVKYKWVIQTRIDYYTFVYAWYLNS